MRVKPIAAGIAMLLVSSIAFSYETPVDLVGKALQESLAAIAANLQTIAIRLLIAFLMLQWAIDGIGMFMHGEVTFERALAKFATVIFWGGFCMYLLADAGGGQTNLGKFMRDTIDYFLGMANQWTGARGGSFDTVDILMIGLDSYSKVGIAVGKATATNVVNLVASVAFPPLAIMTTLAVFAVICLIVGSCAYIALKVFLVKIQVAIWICVAPLAVAMLGLKGLRDNGFSPLKALLGLVFRIIVLAAIVSTLRIMAESFATHIDNLSFGVAADIITPMIAAAFGFLLIAFLTHQADEVAASISSGAISMNSGNLANSIATGVSAGLTGAAGVAVLQQITGGSLMGGLNELKMPQPMPKFAGGTGEGGGGNNRFMRDSLSPSSSLKPDFPAQPKGAEPEAPKSTHGHAGGGGERGTKEAKSPMSRATPDKSGQQKPAAGESPQQQQPAGIGGAGGAERKPSAAREFAHQAERLGDKLSSDQAQPTIHIDTRLD